MAGCRGKWRLNADMSEKEARMAGVGRRAAKRAHTAEVVDNTKRLWCWSGVLVTLAI